MYNVLKTNNKIDKIDFNSGDGLKFDGIDDYVTIPYNSGWALKNTDSFSLSFIVKCINPLDTNQNFLFSTENFLSGYNSGIRFAIRPSTGLILSASLRQSTSPESGVALSKLGAFDNTIVNHFVATWRNKEPISIYVNGVLLTGTSYTVNSIVSIENTEPIVTYNKITNVFNNIIMDDFKLFRKELTQLEVTKLYQTQGQLIPSTAQANLLADWRFEDKQGTILKDYSPNNYNGTLTNFSNTTLGVNNAWVNKYGNSIQQL